MGVAKCLVKSSVRLTTYQRLKFVQNQPIKSQNQKELNPKLFDLQSQWKNCYRLYLVIATVVVKYHVIIFETSPISKLLWPILPRKLPLPLQRRRNQNPELKNHFEKVLKLELFLEVYLVQIMALEKLIKVVYAQWMTSQLLTYHSLQNLPP